MDGSGTNSDDFLRIKYPLAGIPVSDLVAALAVVAAAVPSEHGEPRVLQLDTPQDGMLHVQTGSLAGMRAGSGRHIVLRRTEHGWEIATITTWRA